MMERDVNERSFLNGLNPEQKEAVLYGDGPMLVLAGAGSGKTRVLTCRVANLIKQGISPYNILAVTFTNKAAREMRERIRRMVDADVWVSTFHSACLRILKMEGEHTGLSKNFSIYDDSDQITVIKECLKELKIDPKQFNPRMVKDRISRAKDAMIDVDLFAEESGSYHDEVLSRIYSKYEKKLKKYNAVDFGGLIMKCIQLFNENPPILRKYQERFRYILIDEYQDTNRSQYRWVRLLAAQYKNLTVVGDPDQSIYGWRGADIENILSFESDYDNTKVVRLETNYRSTANILEASNSLIANNFSRKEKELRTEQDAGELLTISERKDERDEAAFVANKVDSLRMEGISLDEVVVFYRTHSQSRVLEEFLRKYNMPYRIVGGLRFYDRKEIKDLMAFLKVIVTPEDEVSLKRIINVPTRGIGKKAIEYIDIYKDACGSSFYDALKQLDFIPGLSSRARKSARSFFELIEYWRKQHDVMLASDIINDVLLRTGYLDMLESDKSVEGRSRVENINEFSSVVMEFEQTYSGETEGSPLAAFLDMISLQSGADTVEEDAGTLSLMTIHTAKGLEFDYVFITGMEEDIFPHSNSIESADGDIEEERRLCYVALTRARKQIYLSYARQRMLYGKTSRNLPSRFLGEIPSEYVFFPVGSKAKTSFQTRDVEYDTDGIDSLFMSDEIEIDYTW